MAYVMTFLVMFMQHFLALADERGKFDEMRAWTSLCKYENIQTMKATHALNTSDCNLGTDFSPGILFSGLVLQIGHYFVSL